jgi:hypothetical protein
MGRNTSSKRPIKLSALIWFLMIELVIQQLIPIIVLANPSLIKKCQIPSKARLPIFLRSKISKSKKFSVIVQEVESARDLYSNPNLKIKK